MTLHVVGVFHSVGKASSTVVFCFVVDHSSMLRGHRICVPMMLLGFGSGNVSAGGKCSAAQAKTNPSHST